MASKLNKMKVPIEFEIKPRKILMALSEEELKEQEEAKKDFEIEMEQKRLDFDNEVNERLNKIEEDYNKVIAEANQQKEDMILEAKQSIKELEKEAYQKGYEEGKQNGNEDGYREAYDNNIEKGKMEAEKIINDAYDILNTAKDEVLFYMKENKQNIINMILTISEKVLRDRFENKDSINSLVIDTIERYELKGNFVLRVNEKYKIEIEKELENLRNNKKLKDDVFVLADFKVEEGNAVFESDNGKITVGIDAILQRIKEELV